MSKPFRSLFSFYGGKSRIAHLYPLPAHDIIREPFAGSAGYSLLHHTHQVRLSDCDPAVGAIWRFLLSPTALEVAHRFIPPTAQPGALVTDLLPADAPEGLLRLCQATANVGTQGAKGIHNQVTQFGSREWLRLLPKLDYWLPRISHWQFTQCAYTDVPNEPATWFIDPPYNNLAGTRYRQQVPSFPALATWVLTRHGQRIVCENEGATWLGFTPLTPRQGIQSRYQKSTAMEVVHVSTSSTAYMAR